MRLGLVIVKFQHQLVSLVLLPVHLSKLLAETRGPTNCLVDCSNCVVNRVLQTFAFETAFCRRS
jgi:hypothetical protein